jgi:hypothetical protein
VKAARRKQKRVHMMMWAILLRDYKLNPALHWMYLLEWAALGGQPDEVPHG